MPTRKVCGDARDEKPRLSLDLNKRRIGTVIWATGFRPDYSWLHVPVLDRKGRLRHEGGIVECRACTRSGSFMRRRKSSFIHGAEDDVRELGEHLAGEAEEVARAVRASRAQEMRAGI